MDATLRLAHCGDVDELAAIYRDTARMLGFWCYTPEQVAAWAGFADDAGRFWHYVMDAETWVACAADGAPIGFCGATEAGEVHSLYVRHDCVRRGLGSRLLGHVLDRGRARGQRHFEAWVTPFSRPLFERAGFRLERVVHGEFNGVMFDRYRVVLDAGPAFGR